MNNTTSANSDKWGNILGASGIFTSAAGAVSLIAADNPQYPLAALCVGATTMLVGGILKPDAEIKLLDEISDEIDTIDLSADPILHLELHVLINNL